MFEADFAAFADYGSRMDAASYLSKAIEQLVAERDETDRQIGILQRTLDELTGKPVQQVRGDSGRDSEKDSDSDATAHARPVRDIVLDVAKRSDVFTLKEVVAEVNAQGNDSKYGSISSMISRLTSENVLEGGPRRGTYRLRVEGGKGGAASGDGADEADEPGVFAMTGNPDDWCGTRASDGDEDDD